MAQVAEAEQQRRAKLPPGLLEHLAAQGCLQGLARLAPATGEDVVRVRVVDDEDLLADEHHGTHRSNQLLGRQHRAEVLADPQARGAPDGIVLSTGGVAGNQRGECIHERLLVLKAPVPPL
jgi:hypothetical protein